MSLYDCLNPIFLGGDLFSSPTGKRLLGSRWEDNIRMELKEIGINTWNWVGSAQYKDYWKTLVNVTLNFWVP
jgi:hypothetical protein